MTNKAICEAFSGGAISGKSNSMFIEGDYIYSYGYHFPLAYRSKTIPFDFYFNKDKYSRTTSRHQSQLLRALQYKLVYKTNTDHLKNIKNYIQPI